MAKVVNSSFICWQILETVERVERRLLAEHLPKRGLDVAVRQSPHPGRNDERFEGVGARDAETEQLRAELLVGVAQLRPVELDRPHRRLHRHGRLPAVAHPAGVSSPRRS